MNTYLVYYDSLGFESVINLTSIDRKAFLATIGDQPKPYINLHALTLRARYNSHRDPEIWTFASDASEAMIRDCADNCPTELIEMIRKNGVQINI